MKKEIFMLIKVNKNFVLKFIKKAREIVFNLFHYQHNYGFLT
jgi:hypothetical protein